MKFARFVVPIVVIVLGMFLVVEAPKAQAYYTRDLVTNGDFELGASDWSGNTEAIGTWGSTVWHSGAKGAKLSHTNDSISQIVEIPQDADSVNFSVWVQGSLYSINCHPTPPVEIYDFYNPSDVWFSSYGDTTIGWRNIQTSLDQYSGRKAVIRLLYAIDATYFDDVSLISETGDTTVPTAVINTGAVDGSNGYYKTTPSITLAATDDAGGSGVANIQYAWDGGTSQTYASPFVALQGTHTLTYFATDVAGNREATKSLTLKVDTVLPSTTSSLTIAAPNGSNGYYRSASVVTLSGSDGIDGSGINRRRIQ